MAVVFNSHTVYSATSIEPNGFLMPLLPAHPERRGVRSVYISFTLLGMVHYKLVYTDLSVVFAHLADPLAFHVEVMKLLLFHRFFHAVCLCILSRMLMGP